MVEPLVVSPQKRSPYWRCLSSSPPERPKRTSALRHGSRSMPVPPGAPAGFATVRALTRDHILDLVSPAEPPQKRRRITAVEDEIIDCDEIVDFETTIVSKSASQGSVREQSAINPASSTPTPPKPQARATSAAYNYSPTKSSPRFYQTQEISSESQRPKFKIPPRANKEDRLQNRSRKEASPEFPHRSPHSTEVISILSSPEVTAPNCDGTTTVGFQGNQPDLNEEIKEHTISASGSAVVNLDDGDKKQSKAVKPKSRTKSSRTITNTVLAQFTEPTEEEVPTSLQPSARRLLDPLLVEPKPKRKSKGKAKKPAKPQPALFDPERAQLRFTAQEFAFGTSSQLADSQPYDQEYRQAIEESRVLAESNAATESKAALTAIDEVDLSTVPSLWNAGNRGEGESLLPAEPRRSRQVVSSRSYGGTEEDPSTATRRLVIIDQPKRAALKCVNHLPSSLTMATRHPLLPINGNIFIDLEPTAREMSTSTRQETQSPKSKAPVRQAASAKRPPGRPRKNASAPAADSNVAPPKAKGRPKTSARKAADAGSEQKKPRQRRSKKTATKSADDGASATKARSRSPSPVPGSPTPKMRPPSPSPRTKARNKARQQRQARAEALKAQQDQLARMLFPAISRAIRQQPRSSNRSHPSWWEKILLYDPIVVEDLADWLNSGMLKSAWASEGQDSNATQEVTNMGPSLAELERTARDETEEWDGSDIEPLLVQRWCEENGICCLWREGLRGGVKLAY